MKYKTEIMYQSEGKTPAGDPFMTVKQARGYYQYAERGGVDSIAFILYDKNTDKYCLINESKPPMDEREGREVHMTTAFGGSIDMGANTTNQEICQTEVKEEAGYVVPLSKINFVGKTLVSSQMSQMCYMYFVDVTDIKKTLDTEAETQKEKGNKSTEFKFNSNPWMTYSEVIENCDWKSISIITLFKAKQ